MGSPVELTDPKMKRALAHPARIAIWTHLGLRGPATATECAEVAGLSPSACSYHLRTLAKYGFVEAVPCRAAGRAELPAAVRRAARLDDRRLLLRGGAALAGALRARRRDPLAGGALVAATRASTGAFAVDAASFGISALTVWLIPRSPASGTETSAAPASEPAVGNVTFLTVLQKWVPAGMDVP